MLIYMGDAVTTCIRIRPDVLAGLRRLALLKAEQSGGRVSVSGVLEDLALVAIEKAAKRKKAAARA